MMLEGRIAFLTGAGSGIGRAGALALGREGALVVVTDLDGEAAARVAAEIRAAGGRAEASALDVLSDSGVTSAIDHCVERHGRLDILHSHAGIQIPGSLEEVDAADMDASWALNVRSHFVAARAAVPHMRLKASGSIIITSSNSGVQYDRGMIAYATTKHAVIAMTRQMAADHARFNIRFNALCPGFVDTRFNAGFEAQMGGRTGLESYVRDGIPLGRWGSVEEIADGIVYLASDRSSFMTGHALVIDGGECL
ncbi:NAD(P)-dependent dehydrogenase (short-subunit alcohol dehydrogenase family) [Hoeflea marina]|uniref:NAD(P)-dependent dehydrogenase (Short-subunit alcohol dehydrogenase family) n=1 Tax=Hoeflea marina TaxID=274592 RepID=A0A317PHL5_9HYPH|nr:SDR family NAD(P)-dependent oxidoreductase [Hoeflea marina]PWV99921.1 NAD(P)-dependent dehydrogenase (short-subunit alcohol dehydrogenase family) [Hoeflea marina]